MQLYGEHIHSNQLVARKVKEIVANNIASAAKMPTVTPRTVLGEISMNVEANLSGTSSFLPPRNTMRQALLRARKKANGVPPKPKTVEDLIEIPERFSTTADGQRFLLHNSTADPNNEAPNAARIMVYMSDHGRDVLAGCKTWFVDGTFKSAANTLFTQVVFIVGLTAMDKAVPCGFALLPNKERDTYLQLAEAISEATSQAQQVEMTTIMMDFERGLVSAFQEVSYQNLYMLKIIHWYQKI